MQVDSKTTIPRVDYASVGDRVSFYENLKRQTVSDVNVTMPCKVVDYDRNTHKAILRVLFNWRLNNQQIIEGGTVIGITLRRMCAGGFLIDFPIKVGDTGWMIATDRDATVAKQRSEPSLPASPYINSYASGFWIPDQWGDEEKLGINGIDPGRLVIQTKDGSQKISIGQSDIRISATSVYVETTSDTEITTSGNTTINSKNVNLNAEAITMTTPNVSVTGGLSVGAGASGIITANSVVQVDNGIVVGIS